MDGSSLHRVNIVLVEPTHPGNIGATARAMKAMGLERLRLVAPGRFPSAEATARAAGADDVLHQARVVASVEDAIADCGCVLGTTARLRRIEWPVIDAREGARRAVAESARAPVAIVFGRERSGLTNAEIDRCHALIRIPAAEHFSSLNVAAAVQIVAYEMRVAVHGEYVPRAASRTRAATADEIEGFYRHLEATLVAVGYLDPAAPKLLMRRLRRLFSRAGPDRAELNILRGILTAVGRVSGDATSRPTAPAPSHRRSSAESAGDPSGGEAAGDRSGGEAAGDRSGGETTGDRSGGETTGDRSGGETTGDRSGGEAAGDQSGDEVVGDRSGGEAAGDQSGDEVAGAPRGKTAPARRR